MFFGSVLVCRQESRFEKFKFFNQIFRQLSASRAWHPSILLPPPAPDPVLDGGGFFGILVAGGLDPRPAARRGSPPTGADAGRARP